MYNYRSTPTTPRCSPSSPTRKGGYSTSRAPSYGRTRPTSVTAQYSAAPVETIFTLLSRSPYASSSYSMSNKAATQPNINSSLLSSPPRKKPTSDQRQLHQQHCRYSDQQRIQSGTRSVEKQFARSARTTITGSSARSPQRSSSKRLAHASACQNNSTGQQVSVPQVVESMRTLQNSPWHISSNLASLAEFSSSLFSDEEDPTHNSKITNGFRKASIEQLQVNSGLDEIEEMEGGALLKRCQHSKDTDATVHSSHTSQTGSNNHTDEPLIPALPPGSMQSTELMQYILGVLMAEKGSKPAKGVWNSGVYTLYRRSKD